MISHNPTYKAAIDRYSSKFSISELNINLSLKDAVELPVTTESERIINALRGLFGKKAKLEAFKIFIDLGTHSYEELIDIFPTYIP